MRLIKDENEKENKNILADTETRVNIENGLFNKKIKIEMNFEELLFLYGSIVESDPDDVIKCIEFDFDSYGLGNYHDYSVYRERLKSPNNFGVKLYNDLKYTCNWILDEYGY